MINANELRLGNLVILQNKEYRPNESGFIHKVTGITEKFGKHADELGNFVVELERQENNIFEDRYGQYVSYLEPIPLTEDWLIKFGFKDSQKTEGHLLFNWYSDHIGIKGMLGMVKPYKCRYVHQLQNLYFALTGEELQCLS